MGIGELSKRGINPNRLSDKMLRFSYEYLISGNQTQAAIAAGYAKKSAHVRGSRLLKHPLVSKFISNMQFKDSEKYEVRKAEVLEHLLYLATRDVLDLCDSNGKINVEDLRELPKSIRACIDGIKIQERTDPDGNVTVTHEIKLSPKATGVDMALKHKGLYPKEDHNHLHMHTVDGTPDWDKMQEAPAETDLIEKRIIEVENLAEEK